MLSVALMSLVPVSQANAAATDTFGTLRQVDESTMLYTPAADVTIDDTDWTVTHDGVTEDLPRQATDADGHPVWIQYRLTDDGLLVHAAAHRQARGIGHCIAGVLGGAITTGGAGLLAGAGVGTVTLPGVGTVSGALVGGVSGLIGGGLTGGATFC